MRRLLLLALSGLITLIIIGCRSEITTSTADTGALSGSNQKVTEPLPQTLSPIPEFGTPADEQIATSTPSSTPTSTQFPTDTPTLTSTPSQTVTPSPTLLPPTPSGENAIYIYGIQDKTDDPKKCDFIAVPINTGIWRTDNTSANVKLALQNVFTKRPYFGGLENPAYLSNIKVDTVDFKPYSGLVSIRMSGTYVRSGDRCDDSKVRAQVWTTIRQFSEIKTIDILLNGNLLGDILATGKR